MPLDGTHDQTRFRCSYSPIQNFCRGELFSLHEQRALRAFVAVHAADPRIVGYYYLIAGSIQAADAGAVPGGVIPGESAYPIVYLGAIGAFQPLEGKGIGKLMMKDALAKVAFVAGNIGCQGLALDAISEKTAAYYEKNFDMQRFEPGGLKCSCRSRRL